jgi:hypothetical protein
VKIIVIYQGGRQVHKFLELLAKKLKCMFFGIIFDRPVVLSSPH